MKLHIKKFLQEETEKWVQEEILSNEQATAIVSRYGEDEVLTQPTSQHFSWGWMIAGLLVLFGITILLGANWDHYSLYLQGAILVLFAFTALMGSLWGTLYKRKAPLFKEGLLLLGAFSIWILTFLGPYTYYAMTYGVTVDRHILTFMWQVQTWITPFFRTLGIVLIFLLSLYNKSMSTIIIYYIVISHGIIEMSPFMRSHYVDYFTLFYMVYICLILAPLYIVIDWIKGEEHRKVLFFWWFFFIALFIYCVDMFIPGHFGIVFSIISIMYTIGTGNNRIDRASFVGMRFFALVGLFWGAIEGSTLITDKWMYLGINSAPFWAYIAFIGGGLLSMGLAWKWPMEGSNRNVAMGIAIFVFIVSFVHMGYYMFPSERVTIRYIYNGILGILSAYLIFYGLGKISLRIFNLGVMLLVAFTICVLSGGMGFSLQSVGTTFVLEGTFFLICNMYLYRKYKKRNRQSYQ